MLESEPQPAVDDLHLVWSKLLVLFSDKRERFFAVLREHGLTPPHGFALMGLVDGPQKMRDMAEHLNCDASYVTAIVDRLEETGLAVRRPSATDRRVKEIALTDAGVAASTSMSCAMSEPPEVLTTLSASDRATLVRILSTIVPAELTASHVFGQPHRH